MIHLSRSQVRFDSERHEYWLGERQLQGVTSTLIRRAFPDKYNNIAPAILAAAAEKGKALHEAIEFHDNFATDTADEQDPRIAAYERIKKEHSLRTVANEYLVSDYSHYASSIDIVMLNQHDEICLVDTKTTWSLDKQAAALQLSIYKRFFEFNNPGLEARHIYVLWLPNKDTSIAELHELAVIDSDTIDRLIAADQADQPFTFAPIPDEWPALERTFIHWSQKADEANAAIAAVKEKMMTLMQQQNLAAVKTAAATVSFIPAKTTQRFDPAAFRRDNADLYNAYMREAQTAPQIRIIKKQ